MTQEPFSATQWWSNLEPSKLEESEEEKAPATGCSPTEPWGTTADLPAEEGPKAEGAESSEEDEAKAEALLNDMDTMVESAVAGRVCYEHVGQKKTVHFLNASAEGKAICKRQIVGSSRYRRMGATESADPTKVCLQCLRPLTKSADDMDSEGSEGQEEIDDEEAARVAGEEVEQRVAALPECADSETESPIGLDY